MYVKIFNKRVYFILLLAFCFNHIVSAQGKAKFALVTGEEISEGQIAPDAIFEDIAGNVVSLSQFKGKIVLLDVWATWCIPCIQGMPGMDSVYRKNAKDVVMLAVCSADDRVRFDNFVTANKEKYAFTFLYDPNGKKPGKTDFRSVYGINGFPTTMVIDQNGLVAGYGFNHEEIEAIIARLKSTSL